MTKTRFPDPYEGLSDDELDRHFSDLISSHRQRQKAISIRFPEDLLKAIRELAQELGIGYQSLIKKLLERDVEQLRLRRPVRRRPSPKRATPSALRSSRKQGGAKQPTVASRGKAPKKGSEPRPKVKA